MEKIKVICGHFGSGKTEISLAKALEMAHQGEKVSLVDLDNVNPYFRSKDSLEELNKVQALATETPYIIDKLVEHKRGLEQELMTYMGVDNNGSENLEQTHVSVDAVNANNDVINDYGYAIEAEIKKWIEQMNRVFGRNIAIEAVSKPVNSVKEINGGVENEEVNN